MLPAATAAYYVGQQRLTVATLGLTRSVWGRMAPDFDKSWTDVGPRLALIAMSAQLGAARAAEPYLADVLDELGTASAAAGTVVPEAFVGAAGDGRPVDTLLYGAVTTAKEASRTGKSSREALTVGGSWLDMAVQTLVADTGRASVSVGIAARPKVGGYVRMLNPPSCGRCAVLAGKFFRWNEGFQRHPRCDCRHIPASEDMLGDLRTDPRKAIETGNVRGLSQADQRAIADGADVSQVINAHRGMQTADVFGHRVKITTEGTSVRGVAGRRLAEQGGKTRLAGSRYSSARTPRLMPESIYREAKDRDDAIRLLERFGYIEPGAAKAAVAKVVPRVAVPAPRVEAPAVPEKFKIGDSDSRAVHGNDTADGFRYDPARVTDVHDVYLEQQMRGAVPVAEPEMRVMGGGAASGKSSIIRSGDVQLPEGHVLVNADEAKEMIPEYVAGVAAKNPNSAAFVHEESSDMAKRLTSEALRGGYNTVLDGVGNGSIGSLTEKIARARDDGARRIVGDYVTVDTDEAVRRAIARGEKSGRFVPEDVIRHAHGAVSDTFREAAGSPGLFDELRLWDNNGDAPRLIYSQVNGVATILDADAYDSFLRKGPRYKS